MLYLVLCKFHQNLFEAFFRNFDFGVPFLVGESEVAALQK